MAFHVFDLNTIYSIIFESAYFFSISLVKYFQNYICKTYAEQVDYKQHPRSGPVVMVIQPS